LRAAQTQLSWTWMQRSVNVEHKSNTGAEELRSSAAAPAAIFDMLCGAAQHAASAAAESARCVAAAAALREELQRTAAEAAWATAAKLATEQEQLQKARERAAAAVPPFGLRRWACGCALARPTLC